MVTASDTTRHPSTLPLQRTSTATADSVPPLPGWESFPPDHRRRVIQWIVQVARRQVPAPVTDPAAAVGR
jgi:hypothetical protein